MSGKWNASPGPTRPGVYVNVETVGTTGVPGGTYGVVALPIVADWGPLDEFVTIQTEDELTSTYGADYGGGTSTAHLVREALIGGASAVKVYRIADGTEATASVTLDNTGASPAITLTAVHEGTRANSFSVSTVTNAIDGTKDDLVLYESGVELERFTYDSTDITDLGAQINATDNGSEYLVASAITSGTALDAYTNEALSGGDSGETVVAADYTAALDAFEREGGFTVLALDGIDDSTIIDATVAWAQAENEAGRYVTFVCGGPTDEGVTAGITRTQGYDSEYVVSLVTATDVTVTMPDESEVTFTSAQMAPRVAGMIAAAGITSSITRAVLPNVELETPLTRLEVEALIAAGAITFTRLGTDIAIEDGVTSFTSFTSAKDATFGTLSNVRAMQRMSEEMSNIIQTEFIGKKKNVPAVQQAILARIQSYLEKLEAQDVLVNGTEVELDTRFDNSGYELYVLVNARFGYELKRVLITLRAPTLN